jgi:type I restriction enzyme, S subunit
LALDFSESIRPILDRIIVNQQQVNALSAMRDVLLPKLMSGAVRVAVAQKAVADAL